jgi:hypothetical protein
VQSGVGERHPVHAAISQFAKHQEQGRRNAPRHDVIKVSS